MTASDLHSGFQATKTLQGRIQGKWIAIAGLQVYYRTAGSGRIPLLLIHGAGSDSSAFAWKHSFAPLAEHHQVIAIDLPGYGKSQSPAPWHYQYIASDGSIDSPFQFHLQFLKIFLDALEIQKVIPVGISMGGGLSLGLTLKFPDSIERLILVDSYGLGKKIPGGILSYLTVHIPLLNDLLRFTLQRQKKLVQWGLRNLIHNTNAINEELVSDAWQSLREAGRHKTWRSFLKHEINPDGFRTNYVNQLKDVHKPTLIIHGKNDRLFPVKWAERAHQLMPESKLKIIPNCGHIPPREKPEEFNRLVIEYLRKTVMAVTSAKTKTV